ncbi:MAG: hypothetical protein H3C36_11935, partial [Chitinophagaceae bacterium]|nr:hypothetical protein [Chitinophagaceae bacterium]
MKPAFLNLRMFLFIFLSLLSYGSFAQKEGSDISGEELITNYYADVQDLGLVYVFKNSDEHYNRFKKLYNDWLSRLKSISFNRLSKEDQVDYILLKRNILSDQQVLEQNRKDFLKVQYSVPFSPRIISLQQTRRRGDNINAQEAAKSLSGVIKEIQAAKLDVIKNPIETEELRSVAVRSVEELQKGLQNVNSFYNNYDPDFTWWMKKTYPETDAALSDYA